ncbi:MAG: hypothetical protein EAZ07_05765 [Cytophagales bacterium]|nr:MAG: hypothetical protein EAZ07_05765 [Cytophagales bacterium]
MTSEQKKAFLLLKLVIFNYHGLDEEEKKILTETSIKINGEEELAWAYSILGDDFYANLDKAREFFNQTIATYDLDTKVSYLNIVWDSTKSKGFISEMEATGILKMAKDWGVQKELLALIRKPTH